jgi:hypothetical protein
MDSDIPQELADAIKEVYQPAGMQVIVDPLA